MFILRSCTEFNRNSAKLRQTAAIKTQTQYTEYQKLVLVVAAAALPGAGFDWRC
jgi:hypothetical protein